MMLRTKAKHGDQIQPLRMAPNHWLVATLQSRRDKKVMTSDPRRSPDQRSCFLFRIEELREAVGIRVEAMPLSRERACPRTRITAGVPQRATP